MRYYDIQFANADSGAPMVPSSLGGLGFQSLLANGQVNPAALNVELDIPIAAMHAPTGNAFLKIWGLGLADIGAAFNLNGANVSIYGGMSKGLPLANPNQAGLLMKGKVLNAFGNWVGTDQSIDMTFFPYSGSPDDPLNFILNWQVGTTLASALTNTFATAYPSAKQNINISERLVLNHIETGYWGTLEGMATVLNPLSKSIITDAGYPGVQMYYNNDTINVFDLTMPSTAKAILFQDLLGQPTWKDTLTISCKLVMRADLAVGDLVTLPQTLVTNTQSAITRFQDKSVFTGNYNVQSLHHYGNFRQADASSWNTTVEMTPELKAK